MDGKKEKVYSAGAGMYLSLDSVADDTFSSGLMGPGFGINPEKGIIYAPCDGTVSMVFPTGHAIGFTTNSGLEILIHVGIDTVNRKGRGFKVLKDMNDVVKAHEELLHFDMDAIRAEGFDSTIIVVFTNAAEFHLSLQTAGAVTQNTEIALAERKQEEKKTVVDTSKYEYGKMCSEILDAVGGSENIRNVFHCVTRLRIVPANRDLVEMEKLQSVKGLLKVIESSGQLQCVVGTDVPAVYADFLEIAHVKEGGTVAADSEENKVKEKKPNIIIQGLNTLAACVTPGLYAIVAGGMIKGIVSLITAFGWLASTSDIITVLNAVGDAPFYFMPFIIGYAAAKRFKVSIPFY